MRIQSCHHKPINKKSDFDHVKFHFSDQLLVSVEEKNLNLEGVKMHFLLSMG